MVLVPYAAQNEGWTPIQRISCHLHPYDTNCPIYRPQENTLVLAIHVTSLPALVRKLCTSRASAKICGKLIWPEPFRTYQHLDVLALAEGWDVKRSILVSIGCPAANGLVIHLLSCLDTSALRGNRPMQAHATTPVGNSWMREFQDARSSPGSPTLR